jgi:hypothetical protein
MVHEEIKQIKSEKSFLTSSASLKKGISQDINHYQKVEYTNFEPDIINVSEGMKAAISDKDHPR